MKTRYHSRSLFHVQRLFGMQEGGFTMLELVMVVVVLGILIAVVLPRFTNLSSDARSATVWGIAGHISSANVSNVAACGAGYANCVTINDCAGGDALLQTGLPTGYTISPSSVGRGVVNAGCIISDNTTGASATFTITGAP
ncbi:MAG: prepilin-type N-terminal cleavage/methylation domain-containing protein [Magnetococcales bacterium]|nr:prepilin-type N-terminal cleavage/methylation domain-containing protein [Magnetococcales bacterium]